MARCIANPSKPYPAIAKKIHDHRIASWYCRWYWRPSFKQKRVVALLTGIKDLPLPVGICTNKHKTTLITFYKSYRRTSKSKWSPSSTFWAWWQALLESAPRISTFTSRLLPSTTGQNSLKCNVSGLFMRLTPVAERLLTSRGIMTAEMSLLPEASAAPAMAVILQGPQGISPSLRWTWDSMMTSGIGVSWMETHEQLLSLVTDVTLVP